MSNPANVITDRDIGYLMDIGPSLYPSEKVFTYHNWPYHILSVIKYAKLDFVQLTAKGVNDFALNTLLAAAILHDNGYDEDHTSFGCDSKEEFSRVRSDGILLKMGKSKKITNVVGGAIMATKPGEVPVTNLQKETRAADMGNVNDTFPKFVEGFIRATGEQARTTRLKIGIPDVKKTFGNQIAASHPFLLSLVSPVPEFINEDGDVVILDRHKNYQANLRRLSSSTLGGVVRLVPGLKAIVPDDWQAELAA